LRRRKSKRVSARELSNPQWLGTDSRAEENPEAGFPDLTSSSPPNTDDHHLRVGVMFRLCAFWRLRRCNMTPLCGVCRKTGVALGSIEPGWNWHFGDLCVSLGRNRSGWCPLKGVDASGDFCDLWKRVGCRISAGQDGRIIGGPSDSDVFRDFLRSPLGEACEGRAAGSPRRCCGSGTSKLCERGAGAGVGQTNGAFDFAGFWTFRGLGAGAVEREVAARTRMGWLFSFFSC
jgi:hypothetical protein